MKRGQKKISESLIGIMYNNFTIISEPISELLSGKKRRFVECVCVCGKKRKVILASLMSGHSKSCGCISLIYKNRVKASKIRITFEAMHKRCKDPKHKAYRWYGAKGISICKEWDLFENFYRDMESTWKEGLSLDRFPNQRGNYDPGNCRWATQEQQQRNKTNTVFNEGIILEIRKSKLLQSELSKKYNVNQSTISRIKNNKRWK